jgi:hypothetical protein
VYKGGRVRQIAGKLRSVHCSFAAPINQSFCAIKQKEVYSNDEME